MPRQFTIQQVAAHNENNPRKKWYAVIHGDVYRVASMPLAQCTITSVMIEEKLLSSVDASDLFDQEHTNDKGHIDGNIVNVLKSARGCHVGSIVQVPAGARQDQPADHAKHGQPGHQGKNVPHGKSGQNRQPVADDDEEWENAAERRRREEARNRRLRKAYNPLKQDPDDADEYPADAVAMGYLPDLEGRRWREKRMRLSRFIQYNDIPAIEEEDLDPGSAAWLDMDFAKEIRYRRNLKGGKAKRCTGAFRVSRPPPPRSQLRPRYGGAAPGGQQQPLPRDPPDSDASSSSSDDDDDARGGPAVRSRQVQVEGRVRQWYPSNSNRTVFGHLHLATPPVTPQTHPTQQNARVPTQPPPPPPQHPQQKDPEEEQEIAKQRRASELAAAQEAMRNKQKDPAVVNETMDKIYPLNRKTETTQPGRETPGKAQQPTQPREKAQKVKSQKEQEKIAQEREKARKKREEDQRKKREEDQRKQQEKKQQENQAAEQRKQEAAAAENERKLAEQAQIAQEEAQKKKADEQKRQIQEKQRADEREAKRKEEARRTIQEREKKKKAKQLEDAKEKASSQTTQEEAERQGRETKEKAEREKQERKDSDAEKKLAAQRELYASQEKRIRQFIKEGKGRVKRYEAMNYVKGLQGFLVEDPDKPEPKRGFPQLKNYPPPDFSQKTSPKRPAETTQEEQDSNKKIRKDEPQPKKQEQAGRNTGGGGSSSSSKKFGDKQRPFKEGQEPWAKEKGKGQNMGLEGDVPEDDDDGFSSEDPLSGPVQKTGTPGSTGGPAQTPRPDQPRGTSTPGGPGTQSSATVSGYVPGTIPPAAGIPVADPPATTQTPAANRRNRPGGALGIRLPPGAQIPDDLQKDFEARGTKNGSKPSPGSSGNKKR